DVQRGLGQGHGVAAARLEGVGLALHRVLRPGGERVEGGHLAARGAGAAEERRGGEHWSRSQELVPGRERPVEIPFHGPTSQEPPKLAASVNMTSRGAPAAKWRAGTSVGAFAPWKSEVYWNSLSRYAVSRRLVAETVRSKFR